MKKLFWSVEPEGAGSIYVYPPQEDHERGATAYLAAKCKDGWKFDHWNIYGPFEDPVVTYEDAIMFPMWEDRAASAFFTRTWRGTVKEAIRERVGKWSPRHSRIAARIVELMG
jgi:hypothetical protein